MKFTVNMLLMCILYCVPRLAVIRTVIASTVGRSLSRISYLFSYDFLWRRHSFTVRKLYICLETARCFSCSMYRFIPRLDVLAPHD